MIISKANAQIVCDIGGCKNTAKYFIKKQVDGSKYDSLKLCETCAAELGEILSDKSLKKGDKK